jgi:hypothetical protein
MPLLYLSFKSNDPSSKKNRNVFSFTLPNEIPAQNMRLRDATVVLGGYYLEYGTVEVNTIQIQLPQLSFAGKDNGTRLWLNFRNSDILNPRQILSTSSTESGKIPIPMNYQHGRPKYQYNYLDQSVHVHGIDRQFEVAVYIDDGQTEAEFGDAFQDTNKIASIDCTFEYDVVD